MNVGMKGFIGGSLVAGVCFGGISLYRAMVWSGQIRPIFSEIPNSQGSGTPPAETQQQDPNEEVFDGATVYKICETGSNFNSMVRMGGNGGKGWGAVLDGRSMLHPDKLPYRELQRLKNLMRDYCPDALYIP